MSRPLASGERGLVLPSPVLMLSIVATMMAAVAFVATREAPPDEREITTISQEPTATPTPTAEPTKAPPTKPVVERGKVPVEVYNNSGVTGLAGRMAAKANKVGWQVVGTDNWYGTVDATTVYYPKKLKAAAKQLATDLGVERTAPAVEPMRLDRLTLILTGPLS